MKKDNESDGAMNLDDEIEEFLVNRQLGDDLHPSAVETLKVIHQFELQQKELEEQNEELRKANVLAETNVKKYSEFYDNAFPGFFTLSREGEIIELNQSGSQILGSESSKIKNSPFVNFVSSDAKPTFNHFLGNIFTSNKSDSCEVTLQTEDNTSKFVYLTGVLADNKETCLVTALDITERKSREANRDETARLIMMINTTDDFRKIMSDLTAALQKWSGCEAVGIRLSEGDDYPYYETRGFPDAFLRAENQLCTYGIDGNPKLECICGNILCGRIDPARPFFTSGGSFWSNNTTDLLAGIIDADRQIRIYNRCISAGYESLALIPIRSGEKVFGLLQFNDHHPDRFTPALIEDFEKMADYLAFKMSVRKSEEALKKSEQRWATILKSIGDAVITTNKAGKIKFMNSVAEDLTGWELHDAMHKPVKDVFKIIKGQTRIEAENPVNKYIMLGRAADRANDNILIRKDGMEISIDGSRAPIKNKKGKTKGAVFTFHVTTEPKYVDEGMIKAREEAEERDRLKSAFLANMSHEIRTPMNCILGFTELLKEPQITREEQLEYISTIEKSGERMLNIVNDILSISKVESGQMQISISETNANDQVGFIYNLFKREAEQKGINLLCKTTLSTTECTIKTDREKVYAVLTNLVKNAIKFTWNGSIELGYERKGSYLEFYVKDTGSGIPEEQKKLIFERFKQGSESLIRNYEGTGLGLAISKAYVEMLGGKIWFESEIGKGSVFYFTLPYDVAEEEKPIVQNIDSTEGAVSTEDEGKHVKNLKILIAEDDNFSALLLSKIVKLYGSDIKIVRNGVEAVEACQNSADIDLILMDIRMPEMDGYMATERIRSFNKEVIIIAETALALLDDRNKAIEAGCNEHISKPIKKGELTDLIKKYFKMNILNCT